MNDRVEYAMLRDNPDPLQWGWLGSEFSTLAQSMEAQDEPGERELKFDAQPPTTPNSFPRPFSELS